VFLYRSWFRHAVCFASLCVLRITLCASRSHRRLKEANTSRMWGVFNGLNVYNEDSTNAYIA
jgi:hypothetical protein